MGSLKAINHDLSNTLVQLEILESSVAAIPSFKEKLKSINLYPLQSNGLDTLQINLGKMCNQTCAHCHVDAGPDRKEIMTREILAKCLDVLSSSAIKTVDLTGGAPEMNPNFRWFVGQVYRLRRKIIVRSNLTIQTVNPRYRSLPDFFAEHGVKVVSSLPCYTAENTDKQRGKGTFDKSIEALIALNKVGYGHQGSGLEIDLVYNPLGDFLPPPQKKLEIDYKRHLQEDFGVIFNSLLCITNMPISRFLEQLTREGKYETYMQTLFDSFNPCAVQGLMCRNILSVGWDGTLFDCDFNQMLDLQVDDKAPRSIYRFDITKLENRDIILGQHCFGCTAGAGSSCGGVIV